MEKWNNLASREIVEKTISKLKENGIDAFFVPNGESARKKALELIPKGSEVFSATSTTNATIGLDGEINESGNYDSVRKKLYSMDSKTDGKEMRKLGAVPDVVVGSVHAITQDGQLVIASATGSQLPAYAYGAGKVIWIAGSQKIVANLDDAMTRIYQHVLPLESERAKKAYGVAGSNVSKLLIINKEFQPARMHLIIVDEKLGF
ncbi:lactate utilization protein [Candidatus Micrarchaeota archaeon]|nr:lactate utilization protein [Candidatus Micrarchaeota archaeon]